MEIDIKLQDARDKAVSWVTSKGYTSIKASFGDFETPKTFTSHGTEVCPDMTAETRTGKYYFEVGQKTVSERDLLVTKWKLFSQLAQMKNGQLIIFAPNGHKSFVEKIIEDYRILAKVVPI